MESPQIRQKLKKLSDLLTGQTFLQDSHKINRFTVRAVVAVELYFYDVRGVRTLPGDQLLQPFGLLVLEV